MGSAGAEGSEETQKIGKFGIGGRQAAT